ncbi:Pre-mRNA-splicing factor CLF1 [Nakaseomyces bracarensis]|uniref:Pre-mRNA-splicing factor CLF1 n=1 Tax=Nakaseomyces bracarensis TaxID=273131 RepID=A0ABR4NVQ3_9SACH
MAATPTQITVNDILKDVYRKKKKSLTNIEILDLEELKNSQREKRTEFESYLKRNRLDAKQWMRYALYEVEQHDMRRARSVFERALQIHTSYIPLWIRYVDMELKGKYVNHARNILERAVTVLPRVDKLWYKYLLLEESLQHIDVVRTIFDKWCALEPDTHAWDSFVEFELRQENYHRVRDIYSKYVMVHPGFRTWSSWIQFEKVHGSVDTTRSVFSLALDALVNYSDVDPLLIDDVIKLVIIFAEWEAYNKEMERARALYNISLERWPQSYALKDSMVKFERQYGTVHTMLTSIIDKRQADYESSLTLDPKKYETWWLLIDLLEEYRSVEDVKAIYERSLMNNQPETKTKERQWKNYISLWVRYLCFIELSLQDFSYCRKMFSLLTNEIIPHKLFTFTSIWILFAEFEIRQENLTEARKILGRSLGIHPTEEVFKYYVDLETKLREFDRVRKIYESYIKFNPLNMDAWRGLIELESSLGDETRVLEIKNIPFNGNTIFPIQFLLSFNKFLIEFEFEEQNYDEVQDLQEKRLELGNYAPEIWIEIALKSMAIPTETQLEEFEKLRQKHFEEHGDEDELEFEFELEDENLENSRRIFERAITYFRDIKNDIGRSKVFDGYLEFENSYGSEKSKLAITNRMPHIKYKTRTENGIIEEYEQYVFPDDETSEREKINVSKILALAKEWEANNNN